ncbi:2-oxoglutarate and iron-dependent oxygenase domain-containing protein 3-like [Musca vetustissima]|uniref:2-oxoglutarate and iron-dependent oxygenase domain-containing protein 3-like n=1 Tax=Musca vetustissima TaxID=27455 RepID=UPI002AB7BF60|nr:2-oxoglutarate and iron-dependent oxygenase domain-containing protein 3-like [Musca vetustissima]
MTEKTVRQRRVQNTNKQSELKKDNKDIRKNKIAANNEELRKATGSFKHRLWTRAVVVISVAVIVYFYKIGQTKETKFALVKENLALRMQKFKCSEEYEKEMQQFPQCVPTKCGRFVADKLIESNEVEQLLEMATNVINLAGSSGGASILDIQSGALSYGDKFLNIYQMPEAKELITTEHLRTYNLVKGKIKLAIAEHFGIAAEDLHLTYPTFFSRITNATAKTIHDEYWHEHVDKETYPSFHYTSLLYLTSFKKDFKGGRFIFVDGQGENRTISSVEPKRGRVSAFTSGWENKHHVEQVSEGTRFAVTISFSCDKKFSISDPKMPALKE